MSEILDVVNDKDEVIRQAERDIVHRDGLLCRLVYVCFYTPAGEIIFQKRSNTKKNDPGKLTTTTSGHVASGQSYIEAAVRETFEETGVYVNENDLINLGTIRADYMQGEYVSNAIRGVFLHEYSGDIESLKVEEEDGAGFTSYTLAEFERELESNPDAFAVVITDAIGTLLISKVRDLLSDIEQ